jgi:hypothetical protein
MKKAGVVSVILLVLLSSCAPAPSVWSFKWNSDPIMDDCFVFVNSNTMTVSPLNVGTANYDNLVLHLTLNDRQTFDVPFLAEGYGIGFGPANCLPPGENVLRGDLILNGVALVASDTVVG